MYKNMKKKIQYIAISFFTIFALIIGLSIKIEPTTASESYPFNGIISADSLAVHSAANTSSSSQTTELVYGARVTVKSASGSMYFIDYDGGSGYVSSKYVTNVDTNTLTSNASNVESYSDYCALLGAKSFPESYCPYLYYLHSKHPSWIFESSLIGETIDNVAANEVEKVSLQTKNSNYWYYVNGNPKINEYVSNGNHYYYINASTIKSFLDPRNSLFESNIFQFLNFKKNTDAINNTAVSKISNGGNLSNYHNEFISAASESQVNALHLMARSKQEGANSSAYSAILGRFTTDKGYTNTDGRTLDGFYNFYNIGSYVGGGYSSSIQRGLAYAAGYIDGNSFDRPWNTQAKAITGGGKWIAYYYIDKGQHTNYYQKFNINSNSGYSRYTHQYMTNAYAPASEANIIQNAYTAGSLINTNFEFVIPVFSNMGNIYQPVNKSSNNNLASIAISGATFNPTFNKDVTEYNVTITTNNTYFDVSAAVEDSRSSISGTGRINFTNDKATVNITVKAEDGSTKTYTLNVTRVTSDKASTSEIINKMAVKVNGSIIYGISPGTTTSTLLSTVTNNRGLATIKDSGGNAKTSGDLKTGDTITITGNDGSISYTISVKGDINGDSIVQIKDLILVQSHILNKKRLTGYSFYAGDINNDGVINIKDLILIQSHILGKKNL